MVTRVIRRPTVTTLVATLMEMYFRLTMAKVEWMVAEEVCCKHRIVMRLGQEATKVCTGERAPSCLMRSFSLTITTID